MPRSHHESLCVWLFDLVKFSIVPTGRTKNHIDGIEGFWSYAKHILYHYRGVSRYHFPMYLKEIEFRFNHRDDNAFKLFLRAYFGYVSP